VAHTFSCPQGLFFNQITDGCDFLRNVNCGDKDTTESETIASKEDEEDNEDDIETEEEDEVEDPKSLKDILQIVKDAGGIEGLEQQIKEEEDAKKEQEDRRVRISSKTRSRLSQLLNKGQRTKSDSKRPAVPEKSTTPKSSLLSRASSSRSEASLNSLFSRLANKRRLQPTPDPDLIEHEAQESQQRITIVGAHIHDEEPEEVPLVLGVFKPKNGVREKLRETLHNVLAVEMAERAKEIKLEEEGFTDAPNTVTISKNTRVEENRQRERNLASRARKLPTSSEVSRDSSRYVTIQRGEETTEASLFTPDDSLNQRLEEEEGDVSSDVSTVFRPTVSDNLLSEEVTRDTTTPTPFFPTFAPTSSTTKLPVILLTEKPRRQQKPRKLDIINLNTNNDLDNEVKLGSSDDFEQPSSIATEQPVRSTVPFSGRGSRPVPSRNLNESPRLRSKPSNVKLGRGRPATSRPVRPTSPRPRTTSDSFFQTSFEPEQPAVIANIPVENSRGRSPPRQRVLSPQDLASALISRPRGRGENSVPSSESLPVAISSQSEYEYEYYYDYIDDDDSGHVADYDLVPLANKVKIMSDGLPQCYDVGVFPHPFSCKKFVNCYRNPGTGIVGSIYQCPSYLAFDPVGGRCNWVNEIVCTSGNARL